MDYPRFSFNIVKKHNTLILVLLLFSVISCGSETQGSYCPGKIVSVAGRAEDDLYIKSSFNNWSLVSPMTYKDGVWSIELFLEPGSYPYTFYSAKSGQPFLDPSNPLIMFDKTRRYNKLEINDCRYPTVKLNGKPAVSDKNISFKIKFTPGITGLNPDFNRSEIKLGGERADFSFDEKTGMISIDYTANSFGKYTWFFKIFDTEGFASEVLTVPVWVEEKPFEWENAFMYQIMTDRFSNGDKTNDSPLPGIDEKANWQGGDFQGIINKIDENYFTDAGIDVLWISSPVANTENAGKGMGGDSRYYSPYHSYWPIATGWSGELQIPGLETPIEKHFGTEEKLHELIEKAHKKGIRVMFDFVPNHVHTDSYLWKTYKNKGWFNMAGDNGCPANSNGGYTCGWEEPVICWFTDYLADINYKNNDAMEMVINHLIWLIREFDIDGLRLDAIRLMDIEFTTALKTAIQRKVTTTGILFYMIGETFTGDMGWEEIGSYLGETKLDGQFDFPLYHHVVRTFLLQSETLETFAGFLKENDYRYQNIYYKGSIMGNFIGNHDVARALSLANRDFDGVSSQGGDEANWKVWENSPELPDTETPFSKMRNALTFIFTHPGIPIIYQGDEFGMPGANDPDNRRMNIFGNDLSQNQQKNLEHTKILGNFRKEHASLRKGVRKNILVSENIYAFAMKSENDSVIAVFNNSENTETVELDISDLNAKNSPKALFSQEVFAAKDGRAEIILAPFSAELIYNE